jgi:acyl-[acyl-carrier-protein]-phospholipid O-acyltransferase / long-chain-fatty-acid--[acyl-carrier-protein] ligase
MVRFLIFRPYFEWKVLNWFFRMMHAIPVAANDSPEKIAESLELARKEIQHGHTVCIFAKDSITRTGNLLKFRRGLERIASGVNCPIVPIYLDGVWGSIFSFDRGRFLFKTPKRLFEPVMVIFGKPMPSEHQG